MDPFSITVGTVTLFEICRRFGAYLKDIQAGAAHINDEIASLSREVEALRSVNDMVQTAYKGFQFNTEASEPPTIEQASLWSNVRSFLQECCLNVEKLESLVIVIVGKRPKDESSRLARKLGGFRQQLKKQSKEEDFEKLYDRLNRSQNSLQLMLQLIAM